MIIEIKKSHPVRTKRYINPLNALKRYLIGVSNSDSRFSCFTELVTDAENLSLG